MTSSVPLFNVPLDNYRLHLETGRSARINNEGPRWNFDFHTEHFIRLESYRLPVAFKNGSITSFKYLEPASVSFEVRYYFVDELDQPYGQSFIFGHGGSPLDDPEIHIALYVFQKSQSFQSYVDLLRNEEPAYLTMTCIIDENQSRYRTSNANVPDLRPLHEIDIRGLTLARISTSREEVGEGEQTQPLAPELILGPSMS